MSRLDDVLYIEEKIKLLQLQQQTVVAQFNNQKSRIEATIEKLLISSGVKERLVTLEVSKHQAQENSQKELDLLSEEIARMQLVAEFLTSREEDDPTPEPGKYLEPEDCDFIELEEFEFLLEDEHTSLKAHQLISQYDFDAS